MCKGDFQRGYQVRDIKQGIVNIGIVFKFMKLVEIIKGVSVDVEDI